MTTPEALDQLLDQSREAYERGRLARAWWRSLVLVALLGALGFAMQPGWPQIACGVSLATMVFLALWRGVGWERGMRVGMIWGLFPLVCAELAGHQVGCPSNGCGRWCLGACLLSGFVAGGIAGHLLAGDRRAVMAASGFILVTGALGCTCATGSGILGLAAGLAGASVVTLRPRAA